MSHKLTCYEDGILVCPKTSAQHGDSTCADCGSGECGGCFVIHHATDCPQVEDPS